MGVVVEFLVPGPVRGKERPRLGKGGHVYTPARTVSYERSIKMAAWHAMLGREPAQGAVRLTVTARIPIPKSYPKARKIACAAGRLHPTLKPDWDNVAKVTDACNGVVWVDDCQVVDGRVLKLWADAPSLHVLVESL